MTTPVIVIEVIALPDADRGEVGDMAERIAVMVGEALGKPRAVRWFVREMVACDE